MTDDSLIADLIRAGTAPELVGRVSGALVSVAQSRQISADESADTRRDRDLKYQKAKRLQRKTGKQTMSGEQFSSADESADSKNHCSLTPSLSSVLESPSTEVRKVKREQASLRKGTRMEPGATMPAEAFEFALAAGFDGHAATQHWVEFVDYWIAVPGQRGCKLNWSATWRNRVRQLLTGKQKNGGGNEFDRRPGESLGDLGRRMAEHAREFELTASSQRPHDDAGRH
jgi:hypothetical protein